MRARSANEVLNIKYDEVDFDGDWFAAFGLPERYGIWFIWGNSGNGKSIFALKLCKALTAFGKVAFNSLEEGYAKTMQNALKIAGMATINKSKFLLLNESIPELSERLKKQKSPHFIVIDSFQYTSLTWEQYKAFRDAHKNKLIIILSQADGKMPTGRTARRVMYDSALKIWVEGHVAFSKGRYFGPNGGMYVIHEESANLYHGTLTKITNEKRS